MRCRWPYHAELRLQLDLQPLHGAPQVCDLRLAGLDHFSVGGHLLVQLLGLWVTHKKCQPQGPPQRPGEWEGAGQGGQGHLAEEPGLSVPAILLGHGLVLLPHLRQHARQVHPRRCVHLHVDLPGQLAAELLHLLGVGEAM